MSSQSPLGQTLSSAGAFSPFLSPSWLATSQTNERKGFLLGGQLLTRKLPSAVDMKLVPDCLYLLGLHHRRPVWAATHHPPSSSSSSEHFTKKRHYCICQIFATSSVQIRAKLTFFFSSEPFFRSLLAMITPILRVSNTGSVRFDAAANQTAPRLSQLNSNRSKTQVFIRGKCTCWTHRRGAAVRWWRSADCCTEENCRLF